ncbi:hypothetical protein PSENEW3_00006314 [Picochlorum sp. SENEW3]|nr:hypothetical protein PSENEW3_00006314 [Picochlorum sp. SENEW3]
MGTSPADATSSSSEDDEEYAKFASVAVNAEDVRRESVSIRGKGVSDGGAVPEGVATTVSEALWKKLDAGIEFGTINEDSNPSCSTHHDTQGPSRVESSPGLRLFRRGPTVKGDCTPRKETTRHTARTESILPRKRQIDHEGILISDIEPLIVLGQDIMVGRQRQNPPPSVDIPKAKKRRMLRNFELYNTPIDVEEYS